jgi:hypothetical protein
MKKLKSLKQSLLGKGIFKRLRNTISSNSPVVHQQPCPLPTTTTSQLSCKKKLLNLLESSSSYTISNHTGATASSSSTSNAAVMVVGKVTGGGGGTISTSSLISKCKKGTTAAVNNMLRIQCDFQKLAEHELITALNARNGEMVIGEEGGEEFYQIYYAHYIGNSIISYDTNLNGSAANFISKIIDTVFN